MTALAVGLASASNTSQHRWGLAAALAYACAALVSRRSRVPWSRTAALIGVVGALVVPLVWLTAVGLQQMEVGVVERSAQHFLETGTPYLSHPVAVRDFNPYLPGMALFGVPHAVFGAGVLAGARLWNLAGFAATLAAAVAVLVKGRPQARRTAVTGATWIAACPVVALPLAIGGVDPVVVAFVLLALAYAHRGRAAGAGLALGAAAILKWTAWPAIPVVVVLLAATRGARAARITAAVAVAVAASVVAPPLLADPHAFLDNAVLYPFGLSDTASTAASPLLGALLSALLPHGKTVAVVLIGVGAVAVALSLIVRPPTTTAAAAHRLALGLTIAILLSPATRIGYAVYPLTLLIWARCTVLTAPEPTPDQDTSSPVPHLAAERL
ncbi:glycosyltransferase 87 family protein [Streptomyces sp. NBC_01218]|uniref:glycosyltransferase 87 family protein n=1 Tax=Streptomyces sp. NBC_01218 TaxID=2903780 RepID=UPI002E0E16D0|nr:glycosyltransferase 87 family protein [Streptomyces sp. NBC_01218]